MEWEGVNLDRKWRMCMERERRKIKEDEVVDLVARGLVGDLARHMSCLQEQVDQVKRQQLQLILNQIVKATAEVETEEISCPENAKENGNLLLADSKPLSMFDMGKTRNGNPWFLKESQGEDRISALVPRGWQGRWVILRQQKGKVPRFLMEMQQVSQLLSQGRMGWKGVGTRWKGGWKTWS